MAEAKISLKTELDNKGLETLSDSLAESQQKLKEEQKALRDLEKNSKTTREELVKQRKAVNEAKSSVKELTRQYNEASQSAKGFVDQMKNLANEKLGFDFDSLVSNLDKTKLGWMALGGAAIETAKTLVNSGMELSRLSNQFIAFSTNAEQAKETYDKFNEVYRNTNYDEQKVYDMGKALLAVGMNADEASGLVMKMADTAASLGKGVEFADQLTDAFKRLYTGGQLTEKQYKALAEAGIDLTDVQEEMKKGGMASYQALSEKLSQYSGGMQKAKNTFEEMTGDIKGNCVEILRQTAYLADEFTDFSAAMRELCAWIIEVTQAAIDGIKNMISAMRNAKASASDHADVLAEIGTIEEAIGDKSGDAAVKAAVEWQQTYNERMAMLKAERKELEENEKLYNTPAVKPVQAISVSGGGGGSKGGGSSASKKTDATAYNALVQSEKQSLSNWQQLNALKTKNQEITQKIGMIGLTGAEKIRQEGLDELDRLNTQMETEQIMHDKKMASMDTEIAYLNEHPFDGSDKILTNLEQQKALEDTLHEARVANLTKQIELTSKVTADAQNNQANKLNTVQQYWENYAKSVSSSMGQAVNSVISGQKSMGQALKDMARDMVTNALTMMAQWTALVAIFAAFGDPTPARHASILMFGNDGTYVKQGKAYVKAPGKATGGLIGGSGTTTSDTAGLFALSRGEYVLNANATKMLGTDFLDSVNSNPVAGMNPLGGASVSVSVNTLDSASFSEFLQRGGLSAVKQAFFDDDLNFATSAGTF